MANKLAANARKTMGKSKLSKKPVNPSGPSPLQEGSSVQARPRKIAGMNEDRYYDAERALDTLSRAEQHRKDKRLMADMQKVAEHKVASLNSALSGGVSKTKRR